MQEQQYEKRDLSRKQINIFFVYRRGDKLRLRTFENSMNVLGLLAGEGR